MHAFIQTLKEIDGRTIKLILQYEDVEWIKLAQDRDKCQALVNSVTNLWTPEETGNILNI